MLKPDTPAPELPRKVDAATESCHEVMVSATGKRMEAEPSSAVRISGRQSSVSGKYSRTRGVALAPGGGGGGGATMSLNMTLALRSKLLP